MPETFAPLSFNSPLSSLGETVAAPARTMKSPAWWAWASGAVSARAISEPLSKDLCMEGSQRVLKIIASNSKEPN
ncbi:hypothetical protein D3C86_2158540 [compost metagenome]